MQFRFPVWADSAYRSEEQKQSLKNSRHTSQINKRAYKGKPLSERQEVSNRAKSRVRARVEHVFGTWKTAWAGSSYALLVLHAPR